jgi:hypothetical protein
LSQQIVTHLWIASEEKIGADGIQEEWGEEGDRVRAIVAKTAQGVQWWRLAHAVAEVRAQGIVEIGPACGDPQEVVLVF